MYLQEEVIRTAPVVLIFACLVVLGSARCLALLRALLYSPNRSNSAHGEPPGMTRRSPVRHALAVISALTDFADVALMVLALLFLLRYNYVLLPKLQMNPDPHVCPHSTT